MSQLPPDIGTKIEDLSRRGNKLLDDNNDTEGAIAIWRQALALLPEPRSGWEAAAWLYASIGDAQFAAEQYAAAKDSFYEAMNAGGSTNPFVLVRAGETHLKLGERADAIDPLLRAYMLDGTGPFEGDAGTEALDLLRDQGLIDE